MCVVGEVWEEKPVTNSQDPFTASDSCDDIAGHGRLRPNEPLEFPAGIISQRMYIVVIILQELTE